ncbi:MAG: tail fiber domain-containing protein [Betaproteobacteria bacterium]|nr:tail fiber domain-containing protein [Betaproteobacteria bacterium]
MSFISDLFGGDDAAQAALQAAEIQGESVEQAIGFQTGATESALGEFGDVRADLEGIRNLITDPTAQRDFITDNPFFNALAEDAQRRIFSNQAARGKLGSGETALALQNSILLLGDELLGTNINRRFGLADRSGRLATSRAGITQLGAGSITDLITGGGNVEAAGIIGAAEAEASALNTGINTALGIGALALPSASAAGISLSDRNFKENITFINDVNGVPFYFFNYKGESKLNFGTMAQDVPHAVINMGGKKYVDYGVLNGN